MKAKNVIISVLIIIALILYFISAYFLYLLSHIIPKMSKIQMAWSKIGNKILNI